MESRAYECVFNLPLPSNGVIRNNTSHCSLLKAVRPKWSNGVSPPLPDVSATDVHPWVDPRGECSPAAPAAPSSRPLVFIVLWDTLSQHYEPANVADATNCNIH
jgi:hypothetical protein